MNREPNFFVVGAPRSGTTALYMQLELHSDVFVPVEKEPHYFSPDLYHITGLRPSREEYLALFKPAGAERLVGEASTFYLASVVAAERVREFNPAAKIVACLRNPCEMVYSLHYQDQYNHRHRFDELNEIETMARFEFVGDYAQQLDRYWGAFGRENVHIVVFDDFQRDPVREYRSVLDFLGVSSEGVTKFQAANACRRVRYPWLKHLMDGPPAPVRKLVRLLPRPTYRRVMSAMEGIHSEFTQRPTIPEALRKRLQRRFTPEVERLSLMLERDLTHWSRE